MEDNHQQQQQQKQNPSSNNSPPPPPQPSHVSNKTSNEPVRSRWTPKPEQILILESIFNSGMVNPPKDETVRIRKLLEKFGAVGDANVFYWFQNRRSRSRRRQRQIQATLLNDQPPNRLSPTNITTLKPSSIQFEPTSSSSSSSNSNSSTTCYDPSNSLTFLIGDGGVGVGGSSSSSSGGNRGNGIGTGTGVGSSEDGCFYSISNQMGLTEMEQSHNVSSILDTSSNMNYHHHHQQQQQQPGFITVFINGVPTEVPNGSLDMRNMFGQDVMLVHSSGVPVPFNEYGFSLQSLHMGESYFLVSRSI